MNHLPKKIIVPVLLLILFALAQVPAAAQTITATLSGEVKDSAGAVVPGATVTVTNSETGNTKTTETNDDGRYTVTFLQPGTYRITVAKTGFAESVRDNIRLEIAQTATLDIGLGVTAEQATVNVEGDVPLLQTETSNLETTIEQKLVEDLPTADRNIFNFVNLVPGTIDAGTATGNPNGAVGSAGNRNFFDSNFSVSGGRASSNDILLDGVTNTIGDFGGVAISPPQDSIREFKVISGVAPAEYGRTAGGIVTIATKAGGNKFHGSLYEYFQDRELNANGFFRNKNRLPIINVNRNQYGGAIGGPLFLPRFGEDTPYLYNGKNKTFFFFNYEARREDNPFSSFDLITVPTAVQRTGNLSDLLGGNRTDILFGPNNPGGASGTPVRFGQIFNPYGALVPYLQVNANGTTTQVLGRPIIPNNDLSVLPRCQPGARTQACLDPVAFAVLGYIPLPNTTGTTFPNTPGIANNYAINQTSKFTRDIFAGRIDQKISDKQQFFGRFSYEVRRDRQPNYFDSDASNARLIRDRFFNTTLNHVYNLTSTLINNFRYGYTRV
jgi:Carboxypeptidase regulatory-like domain/TonB-dependent Receptor Plug Domain